MLPQIPLQQLDLTNLPVSNHCSLQPPSRNPNLPFQVFFFPLLKLQNLTLILSTIDHTLIMFDNYCYCCWVFILFFLGRLWIEYNMWLCLGLASLYLSIYIYIFCSYWRGMFELRKWDMRCEVIIYKAFDCLMVCW